jgi:hypothetical protein
MSKSNVTSAFIDLATYDELEKYLYDKDPNDLYDSPITYFIRETQKCMWFSQVPVTLSSSSGPATFGQPDWAVNISRAGDYLTYAWLRVELPAVSLTATGTNTHGANGRLRWCKNLMHNLVKDVSIRFNDLEAAIFTSEHLDFWLAFTCPAGKKVGYDNMIGNIPALTQPVGPGGTLPATTLNLPLPFFFARDTGVALPTAALPYNEMRIHINFRGWRDLLIYSNVSNVYGTTEQRTAITLVTDIATEPKIASAQVWGNYAIVGNEERQAMACAPRDIVIEQVQYKSATYAPATQSAPSFDLRFSHAVKSLFFGVRNTTWGSERSQWVTHSPQSVGTSVNFSPSGTADPIKETTLVYENTQRLSQLGSDYFSLIQPYYHSSTIPEDTGMHMYSYALDVEDVNPMGSTNYGKLANLSIEPTASATSITQAGATVAQKYAFHITCVNMNIIRISGGALGFPVL